MFAAGSRALAGNLLLLLLLGCTERLEIQLSPPIGPDAACDSCEEGNQGGPDTDLAGSLETGALDGPLAEIQPDACPDDACRGWDGDGPTAADGDEVPSVDLASDGGWPGPCPAVVKAPEPAVAGLLYQDLDKSSTSLYSQEAEPGTDAPLSGLEVRLIAQKGSEATAWTCANGEFAFGGLAPGTYLLDPVGGADFECTSKNRPRRLPAAVREGEVTVVTIGDSIPKWGPEPRFSARLAQMIEPLADVADVNVAVPGSRSIHWLPGTDYFEEILAPELPEADVVVISVGGNDLMAYFSPAFGSYTEIFKKFGGLDEFMAGLHANLEAIFGEIRTRAPGVDILYIVYFDYLKASYWKGLAGSWLALAEDAAGIAADKARKRLAAVPGLIVADMWSAFAEPNLDPYLSDSVHLSALGHQFYAEQIFLTLGGALVGEAPLGLYRLYGFSEE
jgi:lysophospholipase L1-like esterase